MSTIKFHQDPKVYQQSFDAPMEIYKLSKTFPKEEIYPLTDRIRRSSRSVSTNISEAWGKRNMKDLLSPGLQIRKVKQEKPRLGCNLR